MPSRAGPVPAAEVQRPRREDFLIGDRVGFECGSLQAHIGTTLGINRHTAPVRCDGDPGAGWRVPFPMLRPVFDR